MTKTCGQCYFAIREGEQLYCHRAPPAVVADGGNVHFPFPAVLAGSWCGEFKRAWMKLFKGDGTRT